MASRLEKDRAKQIEDRCQNILMTMLKDEDNKYCVDCDAKGPRWASWNLGIFLCIRCAGIHRNLGVHISKVKSVNLDSWTPEQVVSLQQMGNSRARAVYEANLPDAFRRPQTDSSLEAFIRAKYETKKYIAREWVPPAAPKVNWDKEIDDEIEKQKKKKKSSMAPLSGLNTDKKYSKTETVPKLLPKPKCSVSPKPSRSSIGLASSETKKHSKENADLLGLDNGKAVHNPPTNTQDDIFGSFFSAPQEKMQAQADKPEESIHTNTILTNDLKTEEENFFKQAAPAEEKSKLTKDSILALYSQTPSNQFSSVPTSTAGFQATFPPAQNQFPQQQTHFQQSQSQFQQSHSPFQAFNAPNQNGLGQSQAFQSGFNHFGTTGQLPQQQNNFANQFPNATFPAFGQNGGFQQQNSGFQQQNGGFHQQNGGFQQQNGGFQQQTGGFQPHNAQSVNGTQPALSQQFGNLNLSQQPNNQSVFSSNQSTNLANTLWQ